MSHFRHFFPYFNFFLVIIIIIIITIIIIIIITIIIIIIIYFYFFITFFVATKLRVKFKENFPSVTAIKSIIISLARGFKRFKIKFIDYFLNKSFCNKDVASLCKMSITKTLLLITSFEI